MILPYTRTYRVLVIISTLLAASLACRIGAATPISKTDRPIVNVTNPLPDQVFPVGEPISVNSTAVDPDGIQRVELWVDDTKVRVDNNPVADSPYIVSQSWQSNTPGTHVIIVKAFDAQEVEGQSQPTVITLETQTSPTHTTALGVSPTSAQETTPSTPQEPAEIPTSFPTPMPTTRPAPATPTNTPGVMCTPPPCQSDEVYYCPDVCPGGCGTQCATPTPTPKPPSFEPTDVEVHNIFEPVWEQKEVKDYLGYPTEPASDDRRYARQYFERGYLYWWDRPGARGLIWAVEIPQSGANQGFRWTGPYEDTWDGGDAYSCEAARDAPHGPVSGFGKLWCDRPPIARAIGDAREPERGTGDSTNYGIVQFFQNGVMLFSPLDREVWVLFNGGTWQRHPR